MQSGLASTVSSVPGTGHVTSRRTPGPEIRRVSCSPVPFRQDIEKATGGATLACERWLAVPLSAPTCPPPYLGSRGLRRTRSKIARVQNLVFTQGSRVRGDRPHLTAPRGKRLRNGRRTISTSEGGAGTQPGPMTNRSRREASTGPADGRSYHVSCLAHHRRLGQASSPWPLTHHRFCTWASMCKTTGLLA